MYPAFTPWCRGWAAEIRCAGLHYSILSKIIRSPFRVVGFGDGPNAALADDCRYGRVIGKGEGIEGSERLARAFFIEPLNVIANDLRFIVREWLRRGQTQETLAAAHELDHLFA